MSSPRDYIHFIRMETTERTSSSRALAPRWSTTISMILSVSTVGRRLLRHRLCTKFPDIEPRTDIVTMNSITQTGVC